MSLELDSIKKSLAVIKNDISKFNELTVKNFELTEQKFKNYLNQSTALIDEKNSLSVINKSEKDLLNKAKLILQSIKVELQYKYSADIKKFYFGESIVSQIVQNINNIIGFCNKLLKKNEERGKNELTDFISKIEEIKRDIDAHLKSKEILKSKIQSNSNALSKTFIELKDVFNILKNSIKIESISNKSIDFNLYFPITKTQKKESVLTLVDGMNFDIFFKFSYLPSELKTVTIYKEWNKELQNLFNKKKESEYDSLKLADEFINNKYKK